MTNPAEQDFTEGGMQLESGCDLDQTQRDLIVGAMKREGCSGRNLLVITPGQPLPSESRTVEEADAFKRLHQVSLRRMEAEHAQLLDELHQAGIKLSHVWDVPVRQLRLMAKSRSRTHASTPNSDARPRGPRRPRSATQRSSSRSGDSGDGPGEPSPSDLATPCRCQRCGAELLEPARLCGLCKEEHELAKPNARVCAHPQCDVVLTGKSTQKTCDGPDGPHKRWLSRERRKLRERPEHTSCEDCGRLWLSDLSPKLHPCPACGGVVRVGRPVAATTTARYEVPRNPLAGVSSLVFECLYGNRGLDSTPSAQHEPALAKELSPSENLGDSRSATEPVAVVIDINRFRERHVRFVAAMASSSERFEAVAA